MDLRWLDDVLVLLEEQNLTRAAARQNITQPAFSRRIRSFEDWLGASVLDRGTNRIDISNALRANEVEIRALTARIRELRSSIANFEATGSTVTIAAQHAPIHSTFPDMAVFAKHVYPALRFKLRAGDHRDCVTMFLRHDTDILLCYEAEGDGPLPFGDTIKRSVWGTDYLVPVIGGNLRYKVASDGSVASDLPAVIYPTSSYFGEILGNRAKPFGTRAQSLNVVCETAFSNGIKELVLKGIGIGWLPLSMSYTEIESGELISLASQFGRLPVQNALYAYAEDDMSVALLNAWGTKGRFEAGATRTAHPA
ncbi:MAG: LysR family transcriptional regulator [Roseobacter sp.]